MEKKYALFAGRHEMPENQGPLFTQWDFKTNTGTKTVLYQMALGAIGQFETVHLYVSGLTPALIEFIRDAYTLAIPTWDGRTGHLVLLHYDRDTNSYWRQEMF